MAYKICVDIIILSYAKNEELKDLTIQSINSLISSENPQNIEFDILILESNKSLSPFRYDNTRTIYPDEEFNFNKYLNIGINYTSNKFICLCNNDLIFKRNWASEILKVFNHFPDIASANPFCEHFHPSLKLNTKKEFILGTKKDMLKGILTGWCIFIRRDVLQKIGLFDEQFEFWYADRDYGMTLLKHNIKHALVLKSKVTHIGNQSHNTLEEKYDDFTNGQKIKYEKKWGESQIFFVEFFY